MEKKKLIETMEFDNYAYAMDVKEKSAKTLKRIKMGLIIAAVATLLTILSFVIDATVFDASYVAFFLAIASYIIGGGLKIALKAAWKLGIIGWILFPFPIDIFTGLVTLLFAILGFFFLPIIFVLINYFQQKKNYDDAETYIQYSKPVTHGENE